jgi:hypothetical protein
MPLSVKKQFLKKENVTGGRGGGGEKKFHVFFELAEHF